MKTLLLVTIGIATALAVELAFTPCDKDKDCKQDECCVAEHMFWVLSRRDLIDGLNNNPMSGRCQSYIKEGSSCYYSGPASCGCEVGTKCVLKPMVPDMIPEIGRRDMMPFMGKSACEKPSA